MFFVVIYDIVDDKRRNKILNELKNFGTRVQYSVFECDLERNQITELRAALGKMICEKRDSVRYYFICEECRRKTTIAGKKTNTALSG